MLIGVIELLPQRKSLFKPLLVAFMPQVIAVWCEELGHKVHYQIVTSSEDKLNKDLDVVFISSYTSTAYLAYAIADWYTEQGKIVILGGPHARSYSKDSLRYFDYVLGLTDKDLIDLVLHRGPAKGYLSADKHPIIFPSLEQRWKYIPKNRIFPTIVPMLASTGCPRKCDFCIDSQFDYQAIDLNLVRPDLEYLSKKKETIIALWYDPNFGVKFGDTMNVIDVIQKPSTLKFGAELNIRELTEERLIILKRNNFFGVGPGIESWFSYDRKSGDNCTAIEKVNMLAEKFKLITKYLPLVQANMIFGLDNYEESFELTKDFVNKAPNIYVNYQTITVFGDSTPMGKKYDKLIPIPYNLMDGYSSTNVPLENLAEFYRGYADLCDYSSTWPKVLKRMNGQTLDVKAFYLLSRNMQSIAHYYREFAKDLQTKEFAGLYEGKTNELPKKYCAMIKKELGSLYREGRYGTL